VAKDPARLGRTIRCQWDLRRRLPATPSPENWRENVTTIGALGLDGVRAAMSFEGALDGAVSEGWFEHCGLWLRPKKSAASTLIEPDAAPT